MAVYVLAGVLGGFLLGYLFARLDFLYVVLRKIYDYGDGGQALVAQTRPTSFFEKEKKEAKAAEVKQQLGKIDIDTRTVVTKIDTDSIQKGSEVELGRVTAQEDTINASVSKLAQLKGK